MRRKIFFPCHSVTSVELQPNGEILTTATRKDVEIKLKQPEATAPASRPQLDIKVVGETQI